MSSPASHVFVSERKINAFCIDLWLIQMYPTVSAGLVNEMDGQRTELASSLKYGKSYVGSSA